MTELIANLIGLLTSPLWLLLGLILGLAAAYAVWHFGASLTHRAELSAVAYVAVMALCLIIGAKRERPKG